MSCTRTPDRADAYIDREGALAERLALGLHLLACPPCRTYVRGLAATRGLVAASLRAEVPQRVEVALAGRRGRGREESSR